MRDPTHYALMMVRELDADGFVGGFERPYPDTIRPAIQIVGLREGVSRVSAAQMLILKDRVFFCADTMVNIEPTAERSPRSRASPPTPRGCSTSVRGSPCWRFRASDRCLMLSAEKWRGRSIVTNRRPDLIVDGEMHLEAATPEIAAENYPHSRIQGDANVLIFPDLAAGNIGYKLLQRIGRAESIGPILMGMRRPVSVLPHGSDGVRAGHSNGDQRRVSDDDRVE